MSIFWASDFNPTINFTKTLSFNYGFAEVDLDVSYYNSRKFIWVKSEINGSNKKIILVVL